MSEHPRDLPIIMSAPMVSALLREIAQPGTGKTMTRRIVSPATAEFGSIPAGKLTKLFWEHAAWDRAWPDNGKLHVPCHDQDEDGSPTCDLCLDRGWAGTSHRLYPRVSPGDRLWVREHIKRVGETWRYVIDDKPVELLATDPRVAEMIAWAHHKETDSCSSRYMPRWASRITLDVSASRIERLQDITEIDAKAEGTEALCIDDDGKFYAAAGGTYRCGFAGLWSHLHDAKSWDANPWVVATTFWPRLGNIDAMPEAQAA